MSVRYVLPVVASAALLVLVGCGTATVRPYGAGETLAPTPTESIPKPGQTVTIRKGDTIYALARIHSIKPSDLIAWNRLSNPSTIYPGQVIRLYPPTGSTQATTARTTAAATSKAANKAAAPAVSRSEPVKAVTPTSATPASTGISWRWPAEGTLISRFVQGDTAKQGIGIAGRSGQDVMAAAAGTVVYSGAGLVGYGELIIIKHNDQWLTAYGHNRIRLVSEGQKVRAGERIAEMGRTGAARDMLHFEIRYNGKPVDPLKYLPAQ